MLSFVMLLLPLTSRPYGGIKMQGLVEIMFLRPFVGRITQKMTVGHRYIAQPKRLNYMLKHIQLVDCDCWTSLRTEQLLMSTAVLEQQLIMYQPYSTARTHLLLAGNDTVPISMWRGVESRLVYYYYMLLWGSASWGARYVVLEWL